MYIHIHIHTHKSVSVGRSVGLWHPWYTEKIGAGSEEGALLTGSLDSSGVLGILWRWTKSFTCREGGWGRRAGCRHPATADAAAANRVPGGVGIAGGAIGRGPRRGLGSSSCSLVADL
jgi:hypothetical protein